MNTLFRISIQNYFRLLANLVKKIGPQTDKYPKNLLITKTLTISNRSSWRITASVLLQWLVDHNESISFIERLVLFGQLCDLYFVAVPVAPLHLEMMRSPTNLQHTQGTRLPLYVRLLFLRYFRCVVLQNLLFISLCRPFSPHSGYFSLFGVSNSHAAFINFLVMPDYIIDSIFLMAFNSIYIPLIYIGIYVYIGVCSCILECLKKSITFFVHKLLEFFYNCE